MRKRLRLGGGPSPDTPVHSSSSSQSPLSNPSSPSSLHPSTPPPRDRALQRFSDTVTSRSNCKTNRKQLEVMTLKCTPPLHESFCGRNVPMCINGLTKLWKEIRVVSWSECVLYDYNSMRGIPDKHTVRSKCAGIYQTLIIITRWEKCFVICANFVIFVRTWFIQRGCGCCSM